MLEFFDDHPELVPVVMPQVQQQQRLLMQLDNRFQPGDHLFHVVDGNRRNDVRCENARIGLRRVNVLKSGGRHGWEGFAGVGSEATMRSGAPVPDPIFIGNATTVAPNGGS